MVAHVLVFWSPLAASSSSPPGGYLQSHPKPDRLHWIWHPCIRHLYAIQYQGEDDIIRHVGRASVCHPQREGGPQCAINLSARAPYNLFDAVIVYLRYMAQGVVRVPSITAVIRHQAVKDMMRCNFRLNPSLQTAMEALYKASKSYTIDFAMVDIEVALAFVLFWVGFS